MEQEKKINPLVDLATYIMRPSWSEKGTWQWNDTVYTKGEKQDLEDYDIWIQHLGFIGIETRIINLKKKQEQNKQNPRENAEC